MAKTRAEKDRTNNRNNKKRKLGLKPKKKNPIHADGPVLFSGGNGGGAYGPRPKKKNPIHADDPVLFSGGNGGGAGSDDDDATPTPERIQRLLEPYTKDQLIGFLLDAAATDSALVGRIRALADTDISHRKLFVHGLGWDTTHETVLETFKPYGEIEDCKVVVDKATGRTKGFGFILYRTRAGAAKALKQPQKTIKNRLTHSQLASVGPVPAAGSGPYSNADGRRVYVSNVHADTAPDKLKAFFAKFGEIELGPMGFDMQTGKSRGFALFVYKTQEGAARALEEPYKMFEGHQLHCQKATEKAKAEVPAAAMAPAALLGATQQPVLAAMAAAQNLALYSQNPAYAAMLGQNPLLAAALLNPAAAAMNPMVAVAMNQAAGLAAPQGQAYGGLGIGGGAPSLLGAYGSQGVTALQELQSYQASQLGQSSSMRSYDSYQGLQLGQSSSERPGSSFGGYHSYL